MRELWIVEKGLDFFGPNLEIHISQCEGIGVTSIRAQVAAQGSEQPTLSGHAQRKLKYHKLSRGNN
jgi:hypothetical protein